MYYVLILLFLVLLLLLRKKTIFDYIDNLEELKTFVAKNPSSVNSTRFPNTPLKAAMLNKDINVIGFLLEKGADPNLKVDGMSAVHLIDENTDVKILELLKEYNADFEQLTSTSIKYERELKPYYHLQYYNPNYLINNKDKVEKFLEFLKTWYKDNNIELGHHSWMLDFNEILKSTQSLNN